MTTSPRPELFEALAELCRLHPDWRFGQLIANPADWADQGVWDVEDERMLKMARVHLGARAEREKAVRA